MHKTTTLHAHHIIKGTLRDDILYQSQSINHSILYLSTEKKSVRNNIKDNFFVNFYYARFFMYKGRYVFSWGGGGGLGNFGFFFQKKVLALPHVLIKKLLTPHF